MVLRVTKSSAAISGLRRPRTTTAELQSYPGFEVLALADSISEESGTRLIRVFRRGSLLPPEFE